MSVPDHQTTSFVRRPVAARICVLTSLTAAVALFVVACAGPSPEKTGPAPEEKWAESVCSTTLRWGKEMEKTHEYVKRIRAAPGRDAKVVLLGATLRGSSVTQAYVAKLRALRPPSTDSGRRADEWLDFSADESLKNIAETERYARRLPMSLTLLESIRGLQRIEYGLAKTLGGMVAGVGQIEVQVPGMKKAFEEAGACRKLEAAYD
jgi:hypothetical protein